MMTRLSARHLPHQVTITPFQADRAESDGHGTPVTVAAYVEQKTRLRVDRRSTSPTSGQQIVATTKVFLLPGTDVQARDRVTVWTGTSWERTSEVVDTALFDYRGAPNHVELYLE